jgi:methylenetetrahydrofolate reductase (NADPH)
VSLREDLSNKDFIITTELNPPKHIDLSKLLENAKKIKGQVSAINITDNSGAGMKMASLAASYIMQRETGINAIWQMTCRDRNRLGLQSDLIAGAALGLSNLLILRGDIPIKDSSLKEEKCFDLSTEELLAAINALKSGKDYEEIELKGPSPDFCVAAAAHPGVPDLKTQAETMKRRFDNGIEFFQTQICFEKDQIDKFIESIGEELASKTLLGITPLKTIKQAEFMNKNIWGVTVPDDQIATMQKALGTSDPQSDEGKALQQAQGLALSKELIEHIKKTPLRGIHIMAIGQESELDTIIKSIT